MSGIAKNWIQIISRGHTRKFYNSTEWRKIRLKVLERDHYTCQWYLGKWTDGKTKPDKIRLVKATTVHHIKPLRERPDLALDINNLISLSHEAHEIVEGRHAFRYKRKKPLTEERW